MLGSKAAPVKRASARARAFMPADIEVGVNLPDPEPKTPRQQAMAERLDSYAAERDLYDVVVKGLPPRAASPLRTPKFDTRLRPSSAGSTDESIAAKHQSLLGMNAETFVAPGTPAMPSSLCGGAAGMPAPRSPSPKKSPGERYGTRPDAFPPPVSRQELEALGIGAVCTAVQTPSWMELMTRWSANVDLLHGLTRAQRATIISNSDVRVYREDEEIIRQNAVSVELYVVISGRCAIVLPPLEEVWKTKFSSSRVGHDKILAGDKSLRTRASKSCGHWLDHARNFRNEKLRVQALEKDWHVKYKGVLTKKMTQRWRKNATDEWLKNERRNKQMENVGKNQRMLRKRGRGSKHGIYIPGKGYIQRPDDPTVHEELNNKTRKFADAAVKIGQRKDSARRRSPALGPEQDGVTMEFPPLSSFGEQRAFYNASLDGTLDQHGPRAASLTVCALENNTKVLCVYRAEDIRVIKDAYEESLLEKIHFLRAHHDYGYRGMTSCMSGLVFVLILNIRGDLFVHATGIKEIDSMARLVRRQWLKAGETLVEAGDDADSIYFVLRGQLSVVAQVLENGVTQEKVVNVVGGGCSIGQMGIVMDEKKRTASCKALTDCVVLFCHRYNFMRGTEPAILDAMRKRAITVTRHNTRAVMAAKRARRRKRREERYAAFVSTDAPMSNSSEEEMEDSDTETGSSQEVTDDDQAAEKVSDAVDIEADTASMHLAGDEYPLDQHAVAAAANARRKVQLALAHFMSGRAVTPGVDELMLPGIDDVDGGSKQLTGFRAIKLSQAPKPELPEKPASKLESLMSTSHDSQSMVGQTPSPSRASPTSSRARSTSPKAKDAEVDPASLVGIDQSRGSHSERTSADVGGDVIGTTLRPRARRLECGFLPTEVPAGLLPKSPQLPLCRRRTTFGFRTVKGNKHARQEEPGGGYASLALLRRTQLRFEDDARRKEEKSCGVDLARNHSKGASAWQEIVPTPPSSHAKAARQGYSQSSTRQAIVSSKSDSQPIESSSAILRSNVRCVRVVIWTGRTA